jgi:hypothetical protein
MWKRCEVPRELPSPGSFNAKTKQVLTALSLAIEQKNEGLVKMIKDLGSALTLDVIHDSPYLKRNFICK